MTKNDEPETFSIMRTNYIKVERNDKGGTY